VRSETREKVASRQCICIIQVKRMHHNGKKERNSEGSGVDCLYSNRKLNVSKYALGAKG
jgi:hypothetical protein